MRNQLQFHYDYTNYDDFKRIQLIKMLDEIFQIPYETLQTFYQMGLWDTTYTPFSFFEGDLLVANVSLFSFPILIDGEEVQAAGIQSVMTRPEYRGKGFIRQLLEKLFHLCDDQYSHYFLLADTPSMYEKFGFELVPTIHTYLDQAHMKPTESLSSNRYLYMDQPFHVLLLRKLLARRIPFSKTFGWIDHSPSFFLQLLLKQRYKIRYLSNLKVCIVYEVIDQTFHLIDLIGTEEVPTLQQILEGIEEPFQKIEIHFTPDLLQLEESAITIQDLHLNFMYRGPLTKKLQSMKFSIPPTAYF